ncbi:hypothetical protein G6F70_006206 [Rhizopus microsporus]|nr:hypothetical protein G6F71_006227 [Rhizopus microsporus]KAG1197963.1 hypothetical protein G6F70_006206 [Rhizopus microsporus]KAG1209567.1 hypothetical protein G6F69_006243 [Rhizopus microsporus]KAG1231111.1 hypothetical protein G6F67_005989 [Rhizopus microsporus]KAG1263472.1 hypothetical protein G6F68_005123 [Rhizopus microsporus]
MSITQQEQPKYINALLIPEDTEEDNKYIQPSSSSSLSIVQPNNSSNNNKKRSLDNTEIKLEESSPTPKKERKPRKAPHELLTDAEKKANHIASEKKRRQNIKLGFDQLIDIVPSLTQGNRSEAFILQKSVDHIRHLISVKNDLKSQIKDLQNLLGESAFDDDSSEDDLTYSSF